MNRPLRVLEVTKSTAGVAEYVRWLAAGLDPACFELTVACLSENGAEFAAELQRRWGLNAFPLAMNRYKIDPLSDARLALRLRRIIRQGRFDLIHAHASKPGYLARLAAAGSRTPLIYSPHCFSFHAGAGRLQARGLALLERLAARYLTTRIMTVANGEQALAARYGVGKPELFTTVYSGVEVGPQISVDCAAQKRSLGVPPQAPLVGSVGRLSAQKAPLDFVRMAGQIHPARPDVHFVWIGDGPLEAEGRALAAGLGLDGCLHWAGQRNDVSALLPALDCFVLASHWEGFPIVLLEAMAAGAPAVATDILGNNEAIRDGQDGRLVAPGDAPALAAAVLEVLDNPARAQAYRDSARRRVAQEFSRQAMLQGVASLYQAVAVRKTEA